MATSGNKLIDKYQYNQNLIIKDNDIQLITAKHIVLNQLFTLKKIQVKLANDTGKHKSILNQIQILKQLPIQQHYIKCHKMLKTSNNIYIVYDHIGQNQTLKQFIESNPNLSRNQRLEIIQKIIKCIKQFRKLHIVHAFFNVNNIEINFNHQIKFVNFQYAFDIQKKQQITKQRFSYILDKQFVPPEIKSLKQFKTTAQFLKNADVFCFGKIILEMINKKIIKQKQVKNSLRLQEDFYQKRQNQLFEFAMKCAHQNSQKRCSINQIQSFLRKTELTLNLVSSKITSGDSRVSLANSKSNSNLATSQPYEIGKIKDKQQDLKSIRSSKQNFLKSISNISQKNRKNSFSQKSDTQQGNIFQKLAYQMIQRRNLSLFLLQVSNLLLNLSAVDQETRLILSFLHLKKSGIVICQLAKIIQKAQFSIPISEKQKKQFIRSADYLKLSHFIKKQMNLNKKLIHQSVTLLQNNLASMFKQNSSFKAECESQNINNIYFKYMIIKLLQNIVEKVEYCHSWNFKLSRQKSPQKSLLKSRSNLKLWSKHSERQLESPKIKIQSKYSNTLEVQSNLLQVFSSRSIDQSSKSIKSSRSSEFEEYEDKIVQKILIKKQLLYLSIVCKLFKYETYQEIFERLMKKNKIYNRGQFFLEQDINKSVGQLMIDLKKTLREYQ